IGGEVTDVLPEAVGLAVDVRATVARAVARNPFEAFFGGREVDPVGTVDPQRLDEALQETAAKVGEAMTPPAIEFDGTTPRPVYPEPGLGLDPERSAAALTAAWPTREMLTRAAPPPEVEVPLVEINPVTTAADVDRLLAE